MSSGLFMRLLPCCLMAVPVAAGFHFNSEVYAIDVEIKMEDAKKILESSRMAMEQAKNPEEAKKIGQQIFSAYRVGADPEKEPCNPSAVLHTKRYWLEWFGGVEAAESKKKNETVRMPDPKIQKLLDMPNMEVEVQLCGDDEYFADQAELSMKQGSKPQAISPVDKPPATKGRAVAGMDKTYRALVKGLFAYDSFDRNAKSKLIVTFPDGNMTEVDADLSKVK